MRQPSATVDHSRYGFISPWMRKHSYPGHLVPANCAKGADQAWDEARGHVEALQHVLDMRGGINTLDFELQRRVSW